MLYILYMLETLVCKSSFAEERSNIFFLVERGPSAEDGLKKVESRIFRHFGEIQKILQRWGKFATEKVVGPVESTGLRIVP